MDITPFGDAMGADATGVDVSSISDDDFATLYDAWIEHAVLRLRGQQLDDDSLMEFSRRFGPLERIPMGTLRGADIDARLDELGLDNAYVTAISNIVVDGRRQGGLRNAEAEWHSDMTYIEVPPTASVLYAVEVPDVGGDTHFACQWLAAAALPTSLRERVSRLTIKHDAAHNSVGDLRPGHVEVASPADSPGCAHPILQIHPENGREVLYLGRRDWAHVPGLSLEDSEALLDEVWSYAARPEHCITQRWRVGDLIVWDNRSVLHRRAGFPDDQRRMMRRCQVLAANP